MKPHKESDSKTIASIQALASLRIRNEDAKALAIVASQSFASLRRCPSEANVRSTT
jgi:hypothetical protein